MNHTPRKRFGQNFLHDSQVIHRIIQVVAPASTDHLVEIGPGEGALTRELLPLCRRLDAVELDRDLVTRLSRQFGDAGHFACLTSLRSANSFEQDYFECDRLQ